MMDKIVSRGKTFKLFSNISKTKVTIFSKMPRNCLLKIERTVVKHVSSIRYLGTIMDVSCISKKEIQLRIEYAGSMFSTICNLFIRGAPDSTFRFRLLRCYVFSILYYGYERRTLDLSFERRLEIFEIYTYRRILKISRARRITNTEVFKRLQKKPLMLNCIKRRKLTYLGYTIRGSRYEILRMENTLKKNRLAAGRTLG